VILPASKPDVQIKFMLTLRAFDMIDADFARQAQHLAAVRAGAVAVGPAVAKAVARLQQLFAGSAAKGKVFLVFRRAPGMVFGKGAKEGIACASQGKQV
jgi:hypothetical protein